MVTMVTTTAYGTWLPGDVRSYVDHGHTWLGDSQTEGAARQRMTGPSIQFDQAEQVLLFDALCAAAEAFGYGLTDVAVERSHLHWIVMHQDTVAVMVGRLKNRMRQELGRGRIWTAGYWARELRTRQQLIDARYYVAHHPGLRMLAGQRMAPSDP